MNRIGFSQRLELRQTQALVMTPQLQQAIKMLQLSNLELAEFVDAEIEQNPLLDRNERDPEEPPATAAEAAAAEASGIANGATSELAAALPEALAGDYDSDAAEQWQASAGSDGDGTLEAASAGESAGDLQSWSTINGSGAGSGGGSGDGDFSAIDRAPARPRTLREHLLEQIGTDLHGVGDRLIALYLLDQLDESGYLRGGLDGIDERFGCAPGQVDRVLARL